MEGEREAALWTGHFCLGQDRGGGREKRKKIGKIVSSAWHKFLYTYVIKVIGMNWLDLMENKMKRNNIGVNFRII